jgi:MFS family permease
MTKLQRARFSVFVYFLLCGSAVTVWATHIPVVQEKLGISHAQIGILILLLGAGALASMQAIGGAVDKYGSAKTLKACSIVLGIALFLPGIAVNYLSLSIAMFILGTTIGAIDIAMNAHALEIETAYGRPIFSSFHAMWSIGGVVGTAVSSGALSLNVPMWATMFTWGAVTIIVGLLLSKDLLSRVPVQKTPSIKSASAKIKELYFVIFIGCVSAAAAVIEGVGIDWSALFSIERFNVSVATAGVSIGTFSAAMAVVRFLADKVVAKFGRIFVIRFGALISAMGMALALTSPGLWLSWVGWAIAGIGVSAVVPQCMAFGSDIGEEQNQGRNLAKVVGLTYAGVLGGPAIIGFLGSLVGLQAAMSFGIGLAVFVVLGSIFMSKGKEKYGKAI